MSKWVSGGAGPAIVLFASGFAHAQSVWQGTLFVTAVSGAACVGQQNVGDNYLVRYRAKLAATDDPEAISFVAGGEGGANLIETADAGGLLRGAGNYNAVIITHGDVKEFSYAGQYDLTFSPATLSARTPTISITGELVGFSFTPGCTIKVRAALTLQP